MTKKEYQLFADAVSLIKDDRQRNEMITFLSDVFMRDNERYDRSRFIEWIDRRLNNQSMKGLKYNPKYMPLGIK